MSEKIVNALAEMKRVYIEEVSHKNLLQQKIDEEAVQIQEYKKPKLDPVGKEDDDIDNDGDSDETDSYLLNRRKVRSDEIDDEKEKDVDKKEDDDEKPKKKKSVKESRYYSWRDTIDEDTLLELVDSEEQKQIKEKKVNNYTGKDPVVTINPEVKTESVLLDSEELDEDFIQESIDIVSDYLCEEGLTLEEIEDLIDEVGVEEFSEWVLQFGYESLLSEARAGGVKIAPVTAKGDQFKKTKSNPQGIPQGRSLDRLKKLKADRKAREEKASQEKPSGMTAALKSQSSVAAKKPESKSKGFMASALERDRKAKEKTKELIGKTLQTAGKIGQTASKFGSSVREPFETKAGRNLQATLIKGFRSGTRAARDFAAKEVAKRKVGMKEEFETWVDDLLQEGYDLSSYTWDELYEEYEELQEKAVSEQQQKLFGLALSVKRGETPREKASKEVLKIVDTVSEAEIRKFAGTPHKGIPEKKGELAEKVIQFVRENSIS
jgi:hypothetical protein